MQKLTNAKKIEDFRGFENRKIFKQMNKACHFQEKMAREMKRRFLSPRTIESYLFCIDKFLEKLNKDPRRITKKEILEYLDELVEKGRSGSTLNIYYCAIKFLMDDVLHRNLYLNLRYSKRPKTLPGFLTRDEIKRLFEVIQNKKHKLMIQLLYSTEFRVSELLNLKVKDFQFESNYGWVRRGKGNKDRPFIIAERLKQDIMDYIEENNLNYDDFFFNNKGKRMSVRTVQAILKKARKKAKIKKNIHPHILRHSFGTHLAEDKCEMINIQSLLGHSTLKTTEGYIHNARCTRIKVKSPFDTLY